MHLFFAVHSNSNERRIFHEKNCNSIDTPQDTLKYFSIIVPSVMKGVAKESDAKEGGKKNAKRLEHGHVIWPFLLHAPYLHSVSNQTAKSSLQKFIVFTQDQWSGFYLFNKKFMSSILVPCFFFTVAIMRMRSKLELIVQALGSLTTK